MKICFMKLRDAVRLIALFGMVVSVICFGIGIKVTKNYNDQGVKEVVQEIHESFSEKNLTSSAVPFVEVNESTDVFKLESVSLETTHAASVSHTIDIDVTEAEILTTQSSLSDEEILSKVTERRRRDVQHKRDALGDPIGVNDLKNPQELKDYDYEMKAESSVIDVNRQIQQINTTLPPVGAESSDIDVSEEQKIVVPSTTESTAELSATTTPTTGTSEPVSVKVSIATNETVTSLSEAAGSEAKVLSIEVLSTDDETLDHHDPVETDAVNDTDTSAVHIAEDVKHEVILPSAKVADSDGDTGAAPNDDDSASEIISHHVYVAAGFAICLFLFGFAANCLLLEAVRKEKSTLLPFWMLWCGFAIIYMFSGMIVSGVESKYGHLVLFMILLALFSYFQAVVYNYRTELIKKYDVKPVEMNRLDKRYNGFGSLNVSGEGDSKA